jgi:hypothetical protein
MKFLPTEKITYRTKLKEDEIINRLGAYIEPKKTFRFGLFGSGSTKSYEGQIIGHTFKINRIISYRNSFLPRIEGIIKREFDETTVLVKMRLHIFIIVFLCLWCSGVGYLCFTLFPQKIRNSDFSLEMLIPIGMLLFVYAVTMAAFKFESRKSKKDLQNIFEANIVDF